MTTAAITKHMIKKLKVGLIKKDMVIETGEYFLDVPVDFIDVDEDGVESVVDTKKFGFPFTSTPKEIQEELVKTLATTISDAENALNNQVLDQLNKQADEAVEALSETEITIGQ